METGEGLARIKITSLQERKGPGKSGSGFYNPDQKINRDITVIFLRYARPRLALDGFGATGIRGIRFSLEAGIRSVIAEKNRVSYEIARNNVLMNGADCEVVNESFQAVSSKIPFDFIDVDPYGSPLPYLDQAIFSVKNGGYVGLTATDLSALTGSAAAKTRLRYDAHVVRDAYMHEKGLRLLWRTVIRRAAQLESLAIPQLSLWHSHFYRIIFKVKRGVRAAESALDRIGIMDLHGLLGESYPAVQEGPFWLGELYSKDFLSRMAIPDHLNADAQLLRYVENFRNEDLSLLFIDSREIASRRRTSPMSLEKMKRVIMKMGIDQFGRTNFSHTGLKVRGALPEIIEVIEKISS